MQAVAKTDDPFEIMCKSRILYELMYKIASNKMLTRLQTIVDKITTLLKNPPESDASESDSETSQAPSDSQDLSDSETSQDPTMFDKIMTLLKNPRVETCTLFFWCI